jgi:hypothetical protein
MRFTSRELGAGCFDAVRDIALGLRSGSVDEIDRELGARAGVRFVPHQPAARRRRERFAEDLYEVRIATRREVPTRRDNLHDLCNALAWAAFPASKWALTELVAAVQRARIDGRLGRLPRARTADHDRLALIDEGGVLVAGESAGSAEEALAAGRARALVFGHALVEHALTGRVAVTGAALFLPVDRGGSIDDLRRRLDAALADTLTRHGGWPAGAALGRIPLTALEVA